MSRLFWQMMVSLDGFMEGPNHELDWHVIDDDFNRYGQEMLGSIDGILLGRVTYQLFASYWPTATEAEAPQLNALPKIVCSRTLTEAGWNNSRLVREDVPGEIQRLKREARRDLALFGSAALGSSLLELGLIDELRIMVAPVVLGAGNPMFKGLHRRFAFKLDRTETFGSGVVTHYYQPS